MHVSDALLALVRSRLDNVTGEWLQGLLDATTAPLDFRTFRAEWSRIGRRAGSLPVTPTPRESELLRAVGFWPFAGWGADEVARSVLLLRALTACEHDGHVALVKSLYLRGTIRERQALLRVLAWLPDPARFAEIAEEATRTHVVSVFEALAVHNPYPARWLVRPIFEQMVQKAIALRVPPERIVGLAERITPEPVRMRVNNPRPTSHPALPALLAP